jgi:Flp pilus assembly pilin Flp
MADQRSGQALVEYVVLLALASVVSVAAVTFAGPQLSSAFAQVTAAIADPMVLIPPSTPATPSTSRADPGAASPALPERPASTPAPTPTPSAAPTPVEHDEGHHNGNGKNHG